MDNNEIHPVDLINARMSAGIIALQQRVEHFAQQNNNLRSLMFKVADRLREIDQPLATELVAVLELPSGHNCDGTGCSYAKMLESQIQEHHNTIEELQQTVYKYENTIMEAGQLLGVNLLNPYLDEEYPSCCPNNNADVSVSISDGVN